MPLVLVHAPAVGDVDELLAAVASATAAALRLADGDVIATLVATRGLARSGSAGQKGCWPLLSFHGRHRGSAATADAFAGAALAVAAWAAAARLELVGMSTEWVLPLPPVQE